MRVASRENGFARLGSGMANSGNAWHIPRNPQPPGQATMRFPFEEIVASTLVTVSNGNQFRGSGTPGNQTEPGSALMVRKAGDGTWRSLPVQFQSDSGNDNFFFAKIPANTFQSGDLVQYYFKVGYTDRDTTFLHGTDSKSFATTNEAAAQAEPYSFEPRYPLEATGAFLSFNSGPHEARIFKDSGHIAVAGPDVVGTPHAIVLTLAPPLVQSDDRTFQVGRVLSSSPLANGIEVVQQLGTGQIRAHLTFPMEGVIRYEVTDWQGVIPDRVSISSASNGEEHFYGFGEKFNALDQAGKVVDVLTFDNPGNKGDRSYKVTPWFASTRGYGFHLDSTGRSNFDMRTAARGRYDVSSQTSVLKLNVVFGPKLPDVVARYTALTGRPALPPPWAFGPWISSDIWRTGGEVRYAVTKFRERKIPVSAFVFDSPWEVAYNDFKFNEAQFLRPDTFENQHFLGFGKPEDMMTFFQQSGLKVICWMTPFVNVESNDESVPGQNLGNSSNYPAGEAGNFFVRSSPNGPPLVITWWKGRGSPIDFTKTEARDWLRMQLQTLLMQSEVTTRSGREPAIGGFKTDDGESGNGPNVYIPDSAVYASGLTGREFVNGYCREYHKTVYGVLGRDGLIFARSGFTGTQAFPACWAGDNQPNFGTEAGLPSVITAGLSAAMSGFSIWGHDVGGYENGNFSPVSPADLFMRWAQFGCFSPIMQMHRQVNPATLRQYPWGYAEAGETTDRNKALDNYRFYATLHTRLFPYLYTHAKESEDAGLPIMRPLVLMHQDDPNTFGVQHTYYFGKDLLVAPIIEPKSSQRRVYLPEGTWFDFWTNQQHAGKREITWNNPAQPTEPSSKIPVFVRSGAIVPLVIGEDVETLCDTNYVNNAGIDTWDGGIEFSIYPDGLSQSTIFDGTVVNSAQGAGNVTVKITSPVPRPIILRIHGPRPAAVRRDGTVLVEAASAAAFAAANIAWRFDVTLGFILVKFPHPSGAITVSA
jgi:alpha-D-xyloside xylohydrolase